MLSPVRHLFRAHPFPNYGISNIKWYYLVSVFSAGWFIIGNWLFFALRYVTAYEMTVIEAISFGIGLAFEIPSGAFADLVGKKRTVQLGLSMEALGLMLFVSADISKWFLLIGNIIIVGGFAFISGSLEALAYDSLVEHKKEKHYDEVTSKTHALYPFVFVFTSLSGGLLWKYHEALPFLATILCVMMAVFCSFKLTEPKVDTDHFTWLGFIKHNQIGFRQLLHTDIRRYLPVVLTVLATHYMWSTGVIRIFMASSFGYNGETLSYLVSVIFAITAVMVFFFDKIRAWLGDELGIVGLGMVSALAWFLASVSGNWLYGAIIFLLFSTAGNLQQPWTSSLINSVVPSKYRATTLSTMQFLVQIPYVFIVIFFGKLVEYRQDDLFYIGVGIFTVIALSMTMIRLATYPAHLRTPRDHYRAKST